MRDPYQMGYNDGYDVGENRNPFLVGTAEYNDYEEGYIDGYQDADEDAYRDCED